jgi:hypothetical protein
MRGAKFAKNDRCRKTEMMLQHKMTNAKTCTTWIWIVIVKCMWLKQKCKAWMQIAMVRHMWGMGVNHRGDGEM